jgi:hypothetical protein
VLTRLELETIAQLVMTAVALERKVSPPGEESWEIRSEQAYILADYERKAKELEAQGE